MEAEFESKELKNYVNKILEKENDEDIIKLKELDNITRISLKNKNYKKEILDCSVKDLKLFKNLKDCSIFCMNIKDADIQILNSMKTLKCVYFDFCNFEIINSRFAENIETLIINLNKNFNIKSLENSTNLKTLKFLKSKVDLNNIENVKNIEKLEIYNSDVINIEGLLKMPKLKLINFSGSKVENEEMLDEVKNEIEIIHKEKYYLTN